MLKKSHIAQTAEADELYGATEAPGLGPPVDDFGPVDRGGDVCSLA